MEISRAVMNDFESIVSLDSQIIGSRIRESQIKSSIEENRCIVCKVNEKVKGFLIYHNYFYSYLFIDLIIVSPDMRRLGIAKNLMIYIENLAEKKLFSSTNKSNIPMQKLFQALGYIESGLINHLDEGDPEVVFVKLVE
ncbi:GNAT family N-acetyltransferase [Bacillus sp. AFS041924]|uniref:GNAT family N-acetyltransferase n=1 Tax=Bacillus sp. AFS041924 TaxID=2033503 RepID=UPI000BFDA4D5|nr:GNAT family N-acetyltransferase [Bacillus sp. AFS041924]PGS46820.1 GNAT family N-acetyltransferase [Bacillus sp. AFS041924]